MRVWEAATRWLCAASGISGPAALQLVNYMAAARAALGALPTQQTIIFERFFDEAGGMQLVIHSPFGSRVNRAWGLSLRKRFCRSFNFELQAAATEDTIILSLTTAHSFELAEVARYLHSNTVRPLLVQALCAAPMFPVRWRWSASIALALPRFRGGKKVPAPLARNGRGGFKDAPVPRPGWRAPRTSPGSWRFPTIRWCARPSVTVWKRRWTSRASSDCSGDWNPGRSVSSRVISPSPRRWPSRCSPPDLTRSSMMHRSRSVAPRR